MLTKKTTYPILAFAALLSAAAEPRILTDKHGKTAKVNLLHYNAEKGMIYVSRADREEFVEIPIDLLCEEDRKEIVGASQKEHFTTDTALNISITNESTRTANPDIPASVLHDDHLILTFENHSDTDLENVKLEYVVFYSQEEHIRRRTDKQKFEGTLFEEHLLNLPKQTTQHIKTTPIHLHSYNEKVYDLVWVDLEGKIEGIILKVSMVNETGETLTRQLSHPENLNYKWTTETKDIEGKAMNSYLRIQKEEADTVSQK